METRVSNRTYAVKNQPSLALPRCWFRHVCPWELEASLTSGWPVTMHAGEHAKALVVHVFQNVHRNQVSLIVCAPQISSKSPQFLWTHPEFLDGPRFDRDGFQKKKKLHDPWRQKEKKAQHFRSSIASWLQRHRTHNVSSSSWQFRVVLVHVEQAAFHTLDIRDRRGWSMPSDWSNFEDEGTPALIRQTSTYTTRAALTLGKPHESENPDQISQSAGQLFLNLAKGRNSTSIIYIHKWQWDDRGWSHFFLELVQKQNNNKQLKRLHKKYVCCQDGKIWLQALRTGNVGDEMEDLL